MNLKEYAQIMRGAADRIAELAAAHPDWRVERNQLRNMSIRDDEDKLQAWVDADGEVGIVGA